MSLFQLFPPILLRRRSRNDDGGGDLKDEEENGERENGEGMRGFSSSSWNQGGPLPATAQTRPPGASSLSPSPRPPSLSSLSLLSAKVIPPQHTTLPFAGAQKMHSTGRPILPSFLGHGRAAVRKGPLCCEVPSFTLSRDGREITIALPSFPLPSQISEAKGKKGEATIKRRPRRMERGRGREAPFAFLKTRNNASYLHAAHLLRSPPPFNRERKE